MLLGNVKFTSRVDKDIRFNTRNKFHISAHPCIIFCNFIHIVLFVIFSALNIFSILDFLPLPLPLTFHPRPLDKLRLTLQLRNYTYASGLVVQWIIRKTGRSLRTMHNIISGILFNSTGGVKITPLRTLKN